MNKQLCSVFIMLLFGNSELVCSGDSNQRRKPDNNKNNLRGYITDSYSLDPDSRHMQLGTHSCHVQLGPAAFWTTPIEGIKYPKLKKGEK